MKKKILKNVAILAFALFGLGIIGNNVFATDNNDCTTGGSGATSCSVNWSMRALGVKFEGGCSVSCEPGTYACCNVGTSTCKCVDN